jgi:anti-sigma factor ChrR (cupin superfamily)
MSWDPHADDDVVVLYASGALGGAELRDFEAHLAEGCARCESRLLHYAQVIEALVEQTPPVAPPPDVRARLITRVQAECSAHRAAQASMPASAQAGLHVVRSQEGGWSETPYPGVTVRLLFVDRERRQSTLLVRMEPGTQYPAHTHAGAEECLVVEGDLRFDNLVLRGGDFLRTDPGYCQTVQTTKQGCLLYLTTPMD